MESQYLPGGGGEQCFSQELIFLGFAFHCFFLSYQPSAAPKALTHRNAPRRATARDAKQSVMYIHVYVCVCIYLHTLPYFGR